MASKRGFQLSTGDTPGKPKRKLPSFEGKSRKSLFSDKKQAEECKKSSKPLPWSREETSMLVQYVCLFWKDAWNDKWPTTKDERFWDGCATAVNNACNVQRTGTSCRARVLKSLAKDYKTLSIAEEEFDIQYVLHSTPSTNFVPSSPGDISNFNNHLSPIFKESPCRKKSDSVLEKQSVGDTVQDFITDFKSVMSQRLREQVLNYLYKLLVIEHGGMSLFQFVNADFLGKSLKAMKTLFEDGKRNLFYSMAKCFERHSDHDDGEKLGTRMPLNRMPFGLIDYNLRFFAADSSQKLFIEDHYVQWLATMFAHFGHRWMCLHRGPYWQYEVREDECSTSGIEESKPSQGNIIQDALKLSGIDISSTDYDIVGNEQVEENNTQETEHEQIMATTTLGISESEKEFNRSKSEIIDQPVFPVLLPSHETCNNEMPDALSNQNSMEDYYENNTQETEHEQVMATTRLGISESEKEFNVSESEIVERHVFSLWLPSHETCNNEMPDALSNQDSMEDYHGIKPNVKKQTNVNPWKFNTLKSKVNVASVGVRTIQMHVANTNFTKTVDVQVEALKQVKKNHPSGRWWIKADACDVRSGLRESVKGKWSGDEDLGTGELQKLYKEYNERCKSVQQMNVLSQGFDKLKLAFQSDLHFLDIHGTLAKEVYEKAVDVPGKKQSTMMELAWSLTGFETLTKQANEFVNELSSFTLDMCNGQRGFTTDGEFNSLRTQGRNRPISIVEVIKEARRLVKSIKAEDIQKMFTLDQNGQPLKHHCAIPICDLNWLQEFMTSSKLTLAQACYILRWTLFPFQHNPCPWVKGRGETTVEVLRSILVTYVFRMEVNKLKDMPEDPADFTCNLYQPELDDEGLEFVHHREDHNHLLKRIISCLREGLIPGVDTRYLRDALHDPSTGLSMNLNREKQAISSGL
ncbi:Hypothetical predicted protein [Paramuricea clavata]|uniref:Uncharacterized protein n=1 Tax=Paramuricea clavata TaxID=317549 RepID=A0A6S7GD06_PARCT|nr:Hypothetical predicted protein [Paramuricea clavata]